jgi:hypothetical protein
LKGEEVPTIERTRVVEDDLKEYSSESQFMDLALDLAKETGCLISVVSCLSYSSEDGEREAWPRDKAILCGSLVRLAKLFTGFLDGICRRKFEFVQIFVRLMFETCVNVQYLIKHDSPELCQEYVKYSLQREYELLRVINANIQERGYPLPIEESMTDSIHRSFSSSGFSLEDMASGRVRNWGGKNLFEKAVDLNFDTRYLGFFSLTSHAIHGNWENLLRQHLEEVNGGFTANPTWYDPPARVIWPPLVVSLETGRLYLNHIFPGDEHQNLDEHIDDLERRVKTLGRALNTLLGDMDDLLPDDD